MPNSVDYWKAILLHVTPVGLGQVLTLDLHNVTSKNHSLLSRREKVLRYINELRKKEKRMAVIYETLGNLTLWKHFGTSHFWNCSTAWF